jgi:hypothetical protein
MNKDFSARPRWILTTGKTSTTIACYVGRGEDQVKSGRSVVIAGNGHGAFAAALAEMLTSSSISPSQIGVPI